MARYSRRKQEQSSPLNRSAPAHRGARFISSSPLHKFSATTLFSGALVSSLCFHLVVGIIAIRGFLPHRPAPALAGTIYVDLMPVAHPRGGGGGLRSEVPPAVVPPSAVSERKAPPVAAKEVVKVKGKEAAAPSRVPVAEDDEIRKSLERSIEEMRRRRDLAAADAAIADLKRTQEAKSRTVAPAAAAAGGPDASGTEVGGGFESWVREEFRSGWSSPRTDPKLFVIVDFEYDAQGYLKYYEVRASGDPLYDESIRRAMERFKWKRLPEPLRKAWKNTLKLQPQED